MALAPFQPDSFSQNIIQNIALQTKVEEFHTTNRFLIMDDFTLDCKYETERLGLNINDLPKEVLVMIMSNLSLFHRKRMRRVCKYWNSISYDPSLIWNDWMVVPSVKDLKELEGRHPHRKFINLRINEVVDEYEESDIWPKFGPFIQRVEVHNIFYAVNPVFNDIFKYCSDIKCLALSMATTDIFVRRNENGEPIRSKQFKPVPFAEFGTTTALISLTSIKIQNSSDRMTDAVFNALIRNSDNLTEIDLKFFSSLGSVDYSSISGLLKKQSKVLTHLSLLDFSLGERNLSDLLSCVGKQLVSLNISRGGLLTDDFLSKVCKLFPNLETVTLWYSEFTLNGIKTVFASLKKLSAVFINHTNLIDYGLKNISLINNLRKIDLTNCEFITDKGLLDAFSHKPLPKLEVVIFDGLYFVSDETVDAICLKAPNITYWDLSQTGVGDFGVQSIIHHNKDLRTLLLEGCDNITAIFSGTPSINESKELRELNVDKCSGIEFSSIKDLSLEHLTKISFRVSNDNNFGDNISTLDSYSGPWLKYFVAFFIEACPSLEEVNISLDLDGRDIHELSLLPHVLKVLDLPCFCPLLPREHLTRECRP